MSRTVSARRHVLGAARDRRPPIAQPLDKLTLVPVGYDFIEKNAAVIKSRFNDIFQ
jgi:hypothetical protein